MPVDNKPGNLASCVGDVVQVFLPEAERRKVSVSYWSGLQEEYVFDAQKVQQISYNLLANALKFTPEGSQVAVSLQTVPADENALHREKETGVTLKVSDTGMGIPPDHLPYIFDRFYQAHANTAFSQPGTGIGLSLVKELTELLGGKVSVESRVGLGAAFTVVLPLLTAEGASAQVTAPLSGTETRPSSLFPPATLAQATPHSAEAPLILVVEDNTELREFITGELAGQYRV